MSSAVIEIVGVRDGNEARASAPNLKLALQWAASYMERREMHVRGIAVNGFQVITLPEDQIRAVEIIRDLAGFSEPEQN